MEIAQPITERTFAFAVASVNLSKVLDESSGVVPTMSKQLIRSGTSIGANSEESQSAQSTADFGHKLEETQYWLKLLIAT